MTAASAQRPADGLVDAAVAFLKRYPPFDEMELAALRTLAQNLAVGYYPKGTAILTPQHGEPLYLYVVHRGLVHVNAPTAEPASDAPPMVLMPGETFSVGALLERRAVRTPYVAAADTFCYQVPAAAFREAGATIVSQNGSFQVAVRDVEQLNALIDKARSAGAMLTEASPVRSTLEDVFVDLVRAGDAAQQEAIQ